MHELTVVDSGILCIALDLDVHPGDDTNHAAQFYERVTDRVLSLFPEIQIEYRTMHGGSQVRFCFSVEEGDKKRKIIAFFRAFAIGYNFRDSLL